MKGNCAALSYNPIILPLLLTPILDLVRFYPSLRDYRVLTLPPHQISTSLVLSSTYLHYLPPLSKRLYIPLTLETLRF